MRNTSKLYAKSINGASFAVNTECIKVSGDFKGGLVTVTGSTNINVGTGQWCAHYITVDGAVVSQSFGGWQYGASIQVSISKTIKVPAGPHTIGIRLTAGVAPAAGTCEAYMEAVELP